MVAIRKQGTTQPYGENRHENESQKVPTGKHPEELLEKLGIPSGRLGKLLSKGTSYSRTEDLR